MTKALINKPVDRLKAVISQDSVQAQFKNALGKHSDLFVASLIDVFGDGLQKCNPALVVQEALKAAVLKLPISKNLGFAYIVPYGNQPQFQIGYKGLIQLAMRSGQVQNINAGPVYDGEIRGYDKLSGTFDFNGERQSDKVVGYFAYMRLINGFEKTVYWTREDVIAHAQKYSKSYNNPKGAWKTNFDSMATKTPLRALFSKYAPLSVDFVQALNSEESFIDEVPSDSQTEEDVDAKTAKAAPPPPKEEKKETLADKDLSDFPEVAHLKKCWEDKEGFGYVFEELMKKDILEDAQEVGLIITHKREERAAEINKAIDEIVG